MKMTIPFHDESGRFTGASSDVGVVLPARPLFASVWSAPPEVPPDELVPYVLPVVENDRLQDWMLTSDVIAFADVTVPNHYAHWRSTWLSAWLLEPSNSVRQLLALASDSYRNEDLDVWRASFSAALRSDRGAWVHHDELLPLKSDSELLLDLVRERDELGYGIVDATPGRVTSGLAYAWSTCCDPELVASDDQMKVWTTPDRGLVVNVAPAGGCDRPIDIEVSEVSSVDDVVVIESRDAKFEVSAERAKPLAWLVPGALRWRVKQVPEVIVWSKTLTSLPECVDHAREHMHPLWLGTQTPGSPRSAPVTDS